MQLIKLENYISRYELDIYRYPGQFIRMKKQRWERVKCKEGMAADGTPLPISQNLKREFAEDVFFFQLRWASSTLKEKSNFDPRYRFDAWLRFLLMRFPDNYLMMYRPVFQVRQAPVELDILIIGPMAVWCVTLLEGSEDAVFQGGSGRFWKKIVDGQAMGVLNPIVSNQRMFRLVSRLLKMYDLETMAIHRVVISPLSYIDYPDAPADIEMIDRRKARQWHETMRKQSSPLKFVQLQTANYLLRHCQTVAFER